MKAKSEGDDRQNRSIQFKKLYLKIRGQLPGFMTGLAIALIASGFFYFMPLRGMLRYSHVNINFKVRNSDISRSGDFSQRIQGWSTDGPDWPIIFRVEYYNASQGIMAEDVDLGIRQKLVSNPRRLEFEAYVKSPTSFHCTRTVQIDVSEPNLAFVFNNIPSWHPAGHAYDQDITYDCDPNTGCSINLKKIYWGKECGAVVEYRGRIERLHNGLVPEPGIPSRSEPLRYYVNMRVSSKNSNYTDILDTVPIERVYYQMYVANISNDTLKNAAVKVNLPPNSTFTKGSCRLINGTYPLGIDVTDGIAHGGVDIGNYSPGSSAKILFTVDLSVNFQPGITTITTVGVAKADGLNIAEALPIINVRSK